MRDAAETARSMLEQNEEVELLDDLPALREEIARIQREAFDAGAAAMRAAALQHAMDVDGERWVFTEDLEGIEVDDLENRP